MVCLFDVNCLIATVDSDHVHHEPMQRWFSAHAGRGWATCPITENGLIRVVSQPAYPSGQRSPAEIIRTLQQLKNVCRESYQFWEDGVSLTNESLFRPEYIIGPRQVTDAYLLGLATKRGGVVLSFDRSLPWQAIRGGASHLIQTPG